MGIGDTCSLGVEVVIIELSQITMNSFAASPTLRDLKVKLRTSMLLTTEDG